MTVLSIINSLASTSSNNTKLSILSEAANSPEYFSVLSDVFRLAYDNSIQFGIKKIPDYTPIGQHDLLWGLDMLSVLYTRAKTGHAAIEHLTFILNMLDVESAEVVRRIVLRDLMCGVTATTANKVWDGLIPDLPLMLAQPMKDKFLSRIRFPAAAQLKADGARCVAIVDCLGATKLVSRNYKEFLGLDHIIDELVCACANKSKMVVDGELICFDAKNKPLDRKTSNGIITKCVKGTATAAELEMIHFQVWDLIPADDYFHETAYNMPMIDRYNDLRDMIVGRRYIHIIECTIVNSIAEARTVFQQYVDQGLEGILLKNLNSPWENKRSNNQVKFKVEITSDLIVVGMYEGKPESKRAGKLGGVICTTKDGLVDVSVGSGFTDDDCEYYWNNPNEIVGKIIEVKHNGVILSKARGAKHSLFLPIFIGIRDDKTPATADTLEMINGQICA